MARRLTPHKREFFNLFNEAALNAREISRLLVELVEGWPGSRPLLLVRQPDEVKELEHEGDRIVSETLRSINAQFVTPYDREDLVTLAFAVDEVPDKIESATELLGLYGVETTTRHSIQLCGLLVRATEELAALLGRLRELRGSAEEIRRIKAIEDEADTVARGAREPLQGRPHRPGARDPLEGHLRGARGRGRRVRHGRQSGREHARQERVSRSAESRWLQGGVKVSTYPRNSATSGQLCDRGHETEPTALRAPRAHDLERRRARRARALRPLRTPRLRRAGGHRSHAAPRPHPVVRLRRLPGRDRRGGGARPPALRPARAARTRADIRVGRTGGFRPRGRARPTAVRRHGRRPRRGFARGARRRGGARRRPPVHARR